MDPLVEPVELKPTDPPTDGVAPADLPFYLLGFRHSEALARAGDHDEPYFPRRVPMTAERHYPLKDLEYLKLSVLRGKIQDAKALGYGCYADDLGPQGRYFVNWETPGEFFDIATEA